VPTPIPTPLSLWLTDRSRFRLATGRCPRARYLANHAGPTGYGYAAAAQALPLVTGQAAHDGLAAFATILQREGRLPTVDEVRQTIQTVQAAYVAKVTERGFRGILGGAQTEETITEQLALISGLIWILRLRFLPWFHENFTVVSIEEERIHLLNCTCGAGPLPLEAHLERDCQGPGLMIRLDLLARRRSAPTLAYFELKTTGWESAAWAEQWETDPQLALGTLGAKARFGMDVSELYIVTLQKGSRRRDKYDPEGRKKQMTPLCYGYCRPGNPPLATDDWLPAYEWQNDEGETKRASRQHKRRGIWELKDSDWPVWQAYRAQDPAMPPEEFWLRYLPASTLDSICTVLGPMNRQDQQLESLERSLAAEEARWQEIVWDLFAAQQPQPPEGHVAGWASAEFQAYLDQKIPCSWICRPFGKEHQCEFVWICHRGEGWQDPIGSGKYKPRRPHHDPELRQAIARGLLVEESQEPEEEE